jgi:hypothetical protein
MEWGARKKVSGPAVFFLQPNEVRTVVGYLFVRSSHVQELTKVPRRVLSGSECVRVYATEATRGRKPGEEWFFYGPSGTPLFLFFLLLLLLLLLFRFHCISLSQALRVHPGRRGRVLFAASERHSGVRAARVEVLQCAFAGPILSFPRIRGVEDFVEK